jgi:hypothetical protein
MKLSRRDFLKLFGISVASLMLTRCKALPPLPPPSPTCYAPLPPTEVTPAAASVRERLRQCWFRFDEVARQTSESGDSENALGQQLIGEHRAALDEMVGRGEISASVADLVQEAYDAAIYHVWRSNAPITCYEPAFLDYAPTSAQILVNQSEALEQIAAQGTVEPSTLATARAALEHDMAYYALTEQEVQALYERIYQENEGDYQSIPAFEALPLDLTPDARAAAEFILELLTGK